MRATVWERIERARERWNVLRHPFYLRWTAGELSSGELARYAGQYRHAVVAVAAMSDSAAGLLGEDPGLRSHAAEEHAHVRLWDGFVDAAGGSVDAAPTAETEACVAEWTAVGDAGATLARLYAIESAQPEIARVKREGLLSRYGFQDGEATEYFRLHERLDVEHARHGARLIDELRATGDDDVLVASAEGALRANWRLLDGV